MGLKTALKQNGFSYEIVELNSHLKKTLGEIINGNTIIYLDTAYLPDNEVIREIVKEVQKKTQAIVSWSRFQEKSRVEGLGLLNKFLFRVLRVVYDIYAPHIRDYTDPFSPLFIFTLTHRMANLLVRDFCKAPLIYATMMNNKRIVIEKDGRFRVINGLFRKNLSRLLHVVKLAKNTGELTRMLKFATVGASGILVNEGILFLLTEYFKVYYLISAAISIETSILSNFTLNELWTFRDRRSKGFTRMLKRTVKYNLVSLGALAINLITLFILVEFFGVYYLLANLIGIFIAFLWNFSINTLWTWRLDKTKTKGGKTEFK